MLPIVLEDIIYSYHEQLCRSELHKELSSITAKCTRCGNYKVGAFMGNRKELYRNFQLSCDTCNHSLWWWITI